MGALCQQTTALTQAIKDLQKGYFQLKGHMHALTTTVTPTEPNLAMSPNPSAALSNLLPASPAAMLLPLPEPRVPTPEHFSGDKRKFRAFRNACEFYFALQPRIFTLETVRVGFIFSLLSDELQS